MIYLLIYLTQSSIKISQQFSALYHQFLNNKEDAYYSVSPSTVNHKKVNQARTDPEGFPKLSLRDTNKILAKPP